MARSALADSPVPSALARLLATETTLEAVLARAHERAGAMVRDAETQATTRAAALDTELAEAARLMESRRSADCAERLALLARENELALGRWRGIAASRVAELACWVANQVLEGTMGEDES